MDDGYDAQEYGQADPYLYMEIGLPRGSDDALHHARVKRRAIDVDGTPVGKPHTNPLLDTRRYEVQFHDGTVETVSANVIMENLLVQVDDKGHRQMLLQEIVDHRVMPDAIPKSKGTMLSQMGLSGRK